MTVQHALLPYWFDIPSDKRGCDLGQLKKALSARGVNARGWRLYLDFGDALFHALGTDLVHRDRTFASIHNAVAFLRLLAACEMDVPPPFALIASINHWSTSKDSLDQINPSFLRAAWKACVLAGFDAPSDHGAVARFIESSVVPVAQWFLDVQDGELSEHRLNAGWKSITSEYQEWKSSMTQQQVCWTPFVQAVEWDGFRFFSLADSDALHKEGETMCHCIGDYTERCCNEMLRAYAVSLRKTGARVATLTVLEMSRGYWMIDELKGRYNEPVHSRVEAASLGVMKSLEDAYRLVPEIRREMDTARRAASPVQSCQMFEDFSL